MFFACRFLLSEDFLSVRPPICLSLKLIRPSFGCVYPIPTKKNMFGAKDESLMFGICDRYNWYKSRVDERLILRSGTKDGTGTVITCVTVRKWRGGYPRNRKAKPRGITVCVTENNR